MKDRFASRLKDLGTETAFAVSQDAAEFAAEGNKVYPFHLGDINIPTPANIMEAANRAMRDGKTGYNPSVGIPQLRNALADLAGSERGVAYNRENVVIQPGGKPVIPKFIQSLMNSGDGVLYPNPGYPIYESQIEFHGGHALPYGFISSSDGFKIDRERVESLIGSNTRLFIYNNYQNPMGAESDIDEMEWVAELAQKHDLWVLSDEAYFEIQYSGKPKSIVSIPGMKERTVILYTFSKTYAMTGWRIGYGVMPPALAEQFGLLMVNSNSCTAAFTQRAALSALGGPHDASNAMVAEFKRRRDIFLTGLREIPGISCQQPVGAFYLFPNITELGQSSQEFADLLLYQGHVAALSGHGFGDCGEGYLRFSYANSVENIRKALERISDCVDSLS